MSLPSNVHVHHAGRVQNDLMRSEQYTAGVLDVTLDHILAPGIRARDPGENTAVIVRRIEGACPRVRCPLIAVKSVVIV
jgi:hypothetical protein